MKDSDSLSLPAEPGLASPPFIMDPLCLFSREALLPSFLETKERVTGEYLLTFLPVCGWTNLTLVGRYL